MNVYEALTKNCPKHPRTGEIRKAYRLRRRLEIEASEGKAAAKRAEKAIERDFDRWSVLPL